MRTIEVTSTLVTGGSTIYRHATTNADSTWTTPYMLRLPAGRAASSTVRDCLSASSPCFRTLSAVVAQSTLMTTSSGPEILNIRVIC